jgi:hypothetical protein
MIFFSSSCRFVASLGSMPMGIPPKSNITREYYKIGPNTMNIVILKGNGKHRILIMSNLYLLRQET